MKFLIGLILGLLVAPVFAYLYFDERLRWNHLAAFVCLVAAVAFAFLPQN